ncbi:O-antigen ligase family protein [Actinomycetospora lemnae]|uniref:O-antigen ligase family protein n=1 Tax=Actinomycetospora lemnae TaxID=3019891 RepID=A0ABT5SVB5_9PSEU|nr:O-antigen ligase family protein [Actinomycetospora sp. DW7H6]MDD7966807.1 O-antigen ligase family protein [Actinomycetospora sp. DW7H6]
MSSNYGQGNCAGRDVLQSKSTLSEKPWDAALLTKARRGLPFLAAALAGVVSSISALGALVLGVGLSTILVGVFWPGMLAALVLPVAFLTYRVGPESLSISVADLALLVVLATLATRVAVVRGLTLLWLVLSLYLALMAAPVLAHPTLGAIAEYAHRVFLVVGSVLAGAICANRRGQIVALRLFILVAVTFSIAADVQAFSLEGGPAYPLGVTKNHAGGLISIGILLLLLLPRMLPRAPRLLALGVLFSGLLSTQARAGIIALAVGVAYVCVVSAAQRRRLMFPLIGGGILAVTSVLSLEAEQEVPADVSLSSTTERLSYWEHALGDWSRAPFLGNGLKYYLDPEVNFPVPFTEEFPDGGPPNPHNILVQTLAESGVVGLLAFVGLVIGVVGVVRRGKGEYALAAEATLLATVFMGAFDIFWLAGRTVVPFFLVGVALSHPIGLGRTPHADDRTQRTWKSAS